MSNEVTILKGKPRPLIQDYEALRKLGLQYIERFSHNVWTDYNVHDPGITAEEIVCYALTDLSYRTALPMEDLLARVTGDTTKDFFTAREILPCNAVTFDDLRKKIIDIKGVENAWVAPYSDPPCADPKTHPAFFIRCNNTPKSIDLRPDMANGFEARNIDGLYEFQLLLEEDPVLGDLNILSVDWEMRDPVTGVRIALVRFIFPLDLVKTYPVLPGDTDIDKLVNGNINNFTVPVFDALNNVFDLTLHLNTGNVVIPQVAYQIRPYHTTQSMSDLETTLEGYISSLLPATKQEIIARIFSRLQQKVIKANGIINEVYCMYQRIRNLSEDVFKIGVVASQEIAVCTDIETEPGADLEDILGRVYFLIDTFFTPPMRFYLLGELLDKGYSVEKIFEGPLLRHGFLREEDLMRSVLFTEVHVSDLYNLIMSIEGVKAIRYLQVTNYLNGIPLTEGEYWKIVLNGSFHLNLDRLRSKITFFKGKMPITADKQVAERIYQDLKSTLSKPRIDLGLKIPNDLAAPVGKYYQLDEYYSIQNDFPAVYGVNKDGIPAEADQEHRSRIKQFKAYLLFFDQLLANYLVQLRECKNLFAVGNLSNETYFYQPVYDAPGSDPEDLNFPDTAPILVDFNMPANADIDDPESYKVAWTAFVANLANGYRNKMNELIHPPEEEPFERRNRFLDHLLGRFSESFADYAVMMYKFTGNQFESAEKKTAEEIANDKQAFLSNYHVLSYNRGKGQYVKCCPTGSCNVPVPFPANPVPDDFLEYDRYSIPLPANPTGLHKRASLMLGMSITDNSWMVLNKFTVVPQAGQFKFIFQYDPGHTLSSTVLYATEQEAFAAMETLVEIVAKEDMDPVNWLYFQILPFGGGFRFAVRPTTASPVFAVSAPVYPSIQAAKNAFPVLKASLLAEGMHIIEHILLRPLPVAKNIPAADLDNGFFPLCNSLNPDCECPDPDYYSFRISVILPYWTQRFRNMDFRQFAEDTIHRETPAHILPKFCWVSMYDLHRLETAYNNWFLLNKIYKPTVLELNNLHTALVELIKTLNTMTNVYPQGHLHDCDNPSTDNPVILGQTILGTF